MLVSINWSQYSSFLNYNVSNVRFYSSIQAVGRLSGNGVLPAWIETNNSSFATSSNVWINMSGDIIDAHSTTTIYMGILQPDVIWNQDWGINSNLDPGSRYGYADNGKNVFLFYDNGNSLMPLVNSGSGNFVPTSVTNAPSPYYHAIEGKVNGGTADANTWTSNGIDNTSSPSLNLPNSYIAQMNVYISGNSPLTDLLTNVNNPSKGHFYVFRLDHRDVSPNEYDLIGYYPAGATSTIVLNYSGDFVSKTGTWYQMTAVDNNDTLFLFKSPSSNNLGYLGTLEEKASGKGYTGGGIAVTTDGASSTDYWTMIIVRNYPPDGIMPSYSFEGINRVYAGPALSRNAISISETNATISMEAISSTGIYSDDQGNIFWTDSYGNVYVNYSYNQQTVKLPSLRQEFPSVGKITSIAAMNYTRNNGGVLSYVALLTYSGNAYFYSMNNGTWLNGSALWGDKPSNFGNGPWLSVTTNVDAGPAHSEYFFFLSYNGSLVSLNPQTGKWKQLISVGSSGMDVISSVGYSYVSHQVKGYVYALSSTGTVYYSQFTNGANWNTYSSNTVAGATGISIGYNLTDQYSHIYLIRYQHSSPLYKGPALNGAGLTSGSFSPNGISPFITGTGISLTFDNNSSSPVWFAALALSGEIAYLEYNNSGNAYWDYFNGSIDQFAYQNLYINSSMAENFSASALYVSSVNGTSVLNMSLYFISNETNLQFVQYNNGTIGNPHIPASVNETQSVLIAIEYIPNGLNESVFHFHVVLYPTSNPNSVVLVYNLYVQIMNRFSLIGA